MSYGRPLSFDPDEALQAAMEVFWAKGFATASLQDLLQATHLSKSSFYQTFGSKKELFARCFNHYCRWRSARMRAGLQQADSAWDFIEDTFLCVAGGAESELEKRGCLLMNTASEFGQRDPKVAELVSSGLACFATVFGEAIEQAQAEGNIDREKDPQSLADFLVSSMSGIRIMVKAGMSNSQTTEIVHIILRCLK